MLHKLTYLIIAIITAAGAALAAPQGAGAQAADSPADLMVRLDSAIARRPVFQARKERELLALRRQLDRTSDPRSRYDLLNQLFNGYNSYLTDSAYTYSVLQEQLARRLNDRNLLANALLNRANVYGNTGMYHEALSVIDTLQAGSMADYLRPYYYHVRRTVYGSMADHAAFRQDRARYSRLTAQYRDSIISVNQPGTLGHAISQADSYNKQNQPARALETLGDYMQLHQLSDHERAICAFTLAEAYELLGDRPNQKTQLLISAISDMQSSVREYVSLRKLALMLYDEGDLDRAYRYMTIALDDAGTCNARQRIIELSDSYPTINGIYVEAVRSQRDKVINGMIVIILLSLLLLGMLIVMRRQMKKISASRRQIEQANDELNKLNGELRQANALLSDANRAIAENSQLKEVYLGRYMDQCVSHIEQLDSYRKSIGKLLNTGKVDDLKKLVKTSAAIDAELRDFYDQFDKTFLSLFPSFVADFNALLQPEAAAEPKQPGSLTPELRIFALIRLGIADSDKIARFLRYSLNTIYNYRTRARNKALGDRNLLEQRVMEIGQGS